MLNLSEIELRRLEEHEETRRQNILLEARVTLLVSTLRTIAAYAVPDHEDCEDPSDGGNFDDTYAVGREDGFAEASNMIADIATQGLREAGIE